MNSLSPLIVNPIERASDQIATFLKAFPQLANGDLNQLSKMVLAHLAQQPRGDVAAAIILAALIAVRDAPDAVRGDQQLPSEQAAERRVLAIRES